jgi:hypothetical protein
MKDLFLCHTGADKDWVRMLGTRLEAERINGRPVEVFFDEWDIDYGENIISKIDQGLKLSRYVGLVLSPRMVKAEWPTAEWQSQVMDDPTGKRGKVLPIVRHKFDPETGDPIDLPFVLKPLKRFDFTRDREFDAEFQRLLRKLADLPPTRGSRRGTLGAALGSPPTGQEAPDTVDEALPSNLFPVLRLPDTLYSDDTPARRKPEVWSALRGKVVPPFTLHRERLISFLSPGASNPFSGFLAGTKPREERTADWLADVDLNRQLVGMLNSGLREHCYHLGIFTSKKDRTQFYCPIFADGEPREFRWGSAGRSRALAKMKARPNGTQFGVHMSASMRFIGLGERAFLLVEPGWLFTTDGVTPLEGREVGRFSTLWGGKERNAAVLRNVLMWGLLIAEGRREIAINLGTADAPVTMYVQSVPSHTALGAGIVGDVVRLDRILGGEGAGEVGRVAADGGELAATDKRAGDGVVESSDRELDELADLALVGDLIPDAKAAAERVADAGEDSETDEAPSADDEDYDSEEAEELELPF